MKTNLAAENHGSPEHLTRVREADVSLKLDTEVKTATNQVDTAE
jgi:hypothetical protein